MIPLVIELALKLVVGLLDSIMVSSVGEAAVSGVSLIDSVFQLLIYIFAALAAGGAIVAGQRLGSRRNQCDYRKCSNADAGIPGGDSGQCHSFRKLLTLEQFRSQRMGELYQQYLASGPMGYVADLFAGMGFANPQKKAASFYAPMFLLYAVYDGAKESEKAEVTALADACLEQYCRELKKERAE